jgi:glycosyltransferase involved in cell wall biosynthesis
MGRSYGITVLICCHNGARTIAGTLGALFSQCWVDFPWEIVLVDNASRDETVSIARTCSQNSSISVRVVEEPQIGLKNARRTGVAAARFDVVSFVDDDNQVSPTWIKNVRGSFDEQFSAGAIGGAGLPIAEPGASLPDWFQRYASSYATGPQGLPDGVNRKSVALLYGAGLNIRTVLIEKIYDVGFDPVLCGRSGSLMLAGDDSEICYALRVIGAELYCDRKLVFRHLIPSARLTPEYLLAIQSGFGASQPTLTLYRAEFQSNPIRAWLMRRYLLFGVRCVLRYLAAALVRKRNLEQHIRLVNAEGIVASWWTGHARWKKTAQNIRCLRANRGT